MVLRDLTKSADTFNLLVPEAVLTTINWKMVHWKPPLKNTVLRVLIFISIMLEGRLSMLLLWTLRKGVDSFFVAALARTTDELSLTNLKTTQDLSSRNVQWKVSSLLIIRKNSLRHCSTWWSWIKTGNLNLELTGQMVLNNVQMLWESFCLARTTEKLW